MKVLKTLAIIAGCILLISFIFKMLQKSVKTRINFNGIDAQNNIAIVDILANNKVVKTYEIPLSFAAEQVYQANDFKLKISQLGNVLLFKVMDDRNNEIAVKPTDKTKNQVFTIYSE